MADEAGRLIRATRFGQYYRITTKDGLCYRLPTQIYNEVYLELDGIEEAIRTSHRHAPTSEEGCDVSG